MYVYGVRCSPADLADFDPPAQVDLYVDYGLLIFPSYTRATCVNSYGYLKPTFWEQVQRVISRPAKPFQAPLEDPFITEGEDQVIQYLRESYPASPAWYYVPRVAWMPTIQVSDLP